MDYLVKPSASSSTLDCCFFGAKCNCQAGNVCAQCTTLCAGNCTPLCGGQFCSPARMDPLSTDPNS